MIRECLSKSKTRITDTSMISLSSITSKSQSSLVAHSSKRTTTQVSPSVNNQTVVCSYYTTHQLTQTSKSGLVIRSQKSQLLLLSSQKDCQQRHSMVLSFRLMWLLHRISLVLILLFRKLLQELLVQASKFFMQALVSSKWLVLLTLVRFL